MLLALLDRVRDECPLPFSGEFYGGLAQFKRTRRTSVVPRPAYREVTVVVIEPEREDQDVPEVAALNDLALAAAIKRIGTGDAVTI